MTAFVVVLGGLACVASYLLGRIDEIRRERREFRKGFEE